MKKVFYFRITCHINYIGPGSRATCREGCRCVVPFAESCDFFVYGGARRDGAFVFWDSSPGLLLVLTRLCVQGGNLFTFCILLPFLTP